jgi:hypothetical protein
VYPKTEAFLLVRADFIQTLTSKSSLIVGMVIRAIIPTVTPQYAAFVGLNLDLNAIAGLITGKQ